MTGGMATEGIDGAQYPYGQSGGTRGISQTNPAQPLNMSGTITAVFEWVPDDPYDPNDVPPTSCIAIENTTAGINAGYPPGSGPSITVNDGIDKAVQLSKPYNLTLYGQRVTPQSGWTITLTCAPSVVDIPPGGAGGINSATVNIMSVFGSVNATVNNVSWTLGNGESQDACAGFALGPGDSTGTFLPYSPPATASTTWYYYQGPDLYGGPEDESVAAATTYTVLGEQTTGTCTEDIADYGPVWNTAAQFQTSGISAYVEGAAAVEDSGLYNYGTDGQIVPFGAGTSEFDSVLMYDRILAKTKGASAVEAFRDSIRDSRLSGWWSLRRFNKEGFSDDQAFLYMQGSALDGKGDHAGAWKFFKQIVAQYPPSEQMLYRTRGILWALRRKKEVIPLFEQWYLHSGPKFKAYMKVRFHLDFKRLDAGSFRLGSSGDTSRHARPNSMRPPRPSAGSGLSDYQSLRLGHTGPLT